MCTQQTGLELRVERVFCTPTVNTFSYLIFQFLNNIYLFKNQHCIRQTIWEPVTSLARIVVAEKQW